MEFLISDTFTDSLARLSGEEQKAVKTTAFDLQMNPASPGMSFHKLDGTKGKNFWSIRVNKDIRIIVHRNESSILLCYVNHHDKAYDWAQRRKIEIHPKTGAAQLVEIRETVQEIIVPIYVQSEQFAPEKPRLFAEVSEDELLRYGVPREWLDDVKIATEDSLLTLADHLPAEAGEALLEFAFGNKPAAFSMSPQVVDDSFIDNDRFVHEDPFKHPDALRRFRVMNNVEELQRALDFPWDKWAVFLHPQQLDSVTNNYSGPARVSGSAGTGKTIVALHRAVYLARQNPDARILLTTYNAILSNSLNQLLNKLISNEPHLAERIDVYPIDEIGARLFKSNFAKPNIVGNEKLKQFIGEASRTLVDQKFSQAFLLSEFNQVIDAWQLKTWADYRDVRRLGRKTRLPEQQRMSLWNIFNSVNEKLNKDGLITYAGLFTRLSQFINTNKKQPYDFVVTDEFQDLAIYHLRFLSSLGGDKPNALFFTGDMGQRIFQQPFSWKSIGVDIRGRARTLNVNYRTSHQIRKSADLLLEPEVTDADGNAEERKNTISVFNGPTPEIITFETIQEEIESVGNWIRDLKSGGLALHEIGIFVRSDDEIDRAKEAATIAAVPFTVLNETMETLSNNLSISTMYLAKGLEFRAVAVMACDDEIIPSQKRNREHNR